VEAGEKRETSGSPNPLKKEPQPKKRNAKQPPRPNKLDRNTIEVNGLKELLANNSVPVTGLDMLQGMGQ